MPVYKFTQFFKHGRQGWSESWYHKTATTTFAQAMVLAGKLSAGRRRLLGLGPFLQGTRVEDVTPVGGVEPFNGRLPPGPKPSEILYNLDGGGTTYKDAAECQAPEDCVLIDLYANGNLQRKALEFHGIPVNGYEAWGATRNLQRISAFYQNTIRNFLSNIGIFSSSDTTVNASAFALRCRVGRGVANFGKLIKDIGTVGGGDYHISINVGADDAWNIGDEIHLHGLKGCWAKGLNGDTVVTRVSVAGADTILTLQKEQCCKATIDYKGDARYWPVSYTYNGIEAATLARYSWRKVGRPSFGTRGRARKRACCSR